MNLTSSVADTSPLLLNTTRVLFNKVSDAIRVVNLCVFTFLLRSQAARGKEGMKDGVSEMGTRLDPVPGLPGGERVEICVQCVN